jgi:N-acetyl-alpha-D-muramate 1-phosphate uridylyltransferase
VSESRGSSPLAAMVMAAGLGNRMRPVTDTRPKPLVAIAGRTLLDHALDRLAEAGIGRAVVNVHYLADQIEAHLAGYDGLDITISDERDQLLETGGGVLRALPLLGPEFLVMNSDSLWLERGTRNLSRLLEAWAPEAMDILLLLAPLARTLGYDGRGDFTMGADGRLARREPGGSAPYVYAGVGVMKASLFTGGEPLPPGPFSLNVLFDRAIAAQRLYGLELDGEWLHVGTPAAIKAAEERIAAAAL